MGKLRDMLKPYLAVIFGALLFLIYLNYLSYQGEALALGIIGVILAAFYLAAGIVETVAGDKLPAGAKKAFNITMIVAFPVFMFVSFLMTVIQAAELMGPTAWTISIISMIASLAFAAIYLVAVLAPQKVLQRLAFLFGAIFTLALLLDILFDWMGAPTALGNVSLILVALYAIYVVMLFDSLKEQPQVEEAPAQEQPVQEVEAELVEEPKEEEKEEPSEEKPAEEEPKEE